LALPIGVLVLERVNGALGLKERGPGEVAKLADRLRRMSGPGQIDNLVGKRRRVPFGARGWLQPIRSLFSFGRNSVARERWAIDTEMLGDAPQLMLDRRESLSQLYIIHRAIICEPILRAGLWTVSKGPRVTAAERRPFCLERNFQTTPCLGFGGDGLLVVVPKRQSADASSFSL
jgi:hypothetical protein